jgi:hypothetical protein
VIYDQSRLSQDGKSYIIYGIDNKVRRIPVAGTEYMAGDSQRLPHYITSGGNVLYVRHPHAVTESISESTETKAEHDKGYSDASQGKSKNPYNPGSPAAAAYDAGQQAYKRHFSEAHQIPGKDEHYALRNNIWTLYDGDEIVHEYRPERGEVVGAKKLLARFDDEGYDVTHVVSPMGVATYLYGKPEEDMDEGYTVTRGIDKERYQERDGLEGPFSTRSGKVVYYDPKEGKYYDPETDFYIGHEDYAKMDEEAAPGVVKAAAGLTLGGIAAAGAPALIGILGPVVGIPFAAYAAYSAAKLGMKGVEKLWDMASEKLGGDDKVAQYANAKLAKLPPDQAKAAAAVVRQIGESKQSVAEGDPNATVGTISSTGTSGGTGRTQFAPTGKTTNAKFNKNGQIELDTEQEDDGSVNLDADAVKQLQQAGVKIKEDEATVTRPRVGDIIGFKPTGAKMIPIKAEVLSAGRSSIMVKIFSPRIIANRNGNDQMTISLLGGTDIQNPYQPVTPPTKPTKPSMQMKEGVDHPALQGWERMSAEKKIEALQKAGFKTPFRPYSWDETKTKGQYSWNGLSGEELDDILHAAKVKASNQTDELAMSAKERREIQRQATQDFEERRQQLHKEKMEMERFAWEKANTEAERKHEIAKIEKEYLHDLRKLQMSHMQDMEKILHADTHELNKMKAEFNMRQAERDKVAPQEPESGDSNDNENNYDQDTGEPLKPGMPPQSNQWHSSQQIGNNAKDEEDDVIDVEARPVNPNKPLGLGNSVKKESTDTLEGILSKFSADYAKFKAGGDIDENQDFFDALYEYYFDEMPYGVKKARDGDPYEWITDRLDQESGITPVAEAEEDEATPGDQAAADQNIIMQIRKASDYEKPTKIKLADGSENVIAPNIAKLILAKFDKMKPESKALLQDTLNTEEGFKEILSYFGGGVREQAATRVGNIMQAAVAEAGFGRRDRRDAYQRDYDSSVAGMGKRQSLAYQLDGGANDEGWDQPERSYQVPQQTYYIRFKDSGKVYKQKGVPKSFANKAAANGYALAMIKNNPAHQGNILLTVSSEDNPPA